jgi:hypothetical protein
VIYILHGHASSGLNTMMSRPSARCTSESCASFFTVANAEFSDGCFETQAGFRIWKNGKSHEIMELITFT